MAGAAGGWDRCDRCGRVGMLSNDLMWLHVLCATVCQLVHSGVNNGQC
jgi:hypothetical protein